MTEETLSKEEIQKLFKGAYINPKHITVVEQIKKFEGQAWSFDVYLDGNKIRSSQMEDGDNIKTMRQRLINTIP